ncbi:MAG: hypothetical protein HPY75_05245 [Actinobacteria bacterium]|nr:hypothetical protein [Actinomycetota bacterium]
MAKLSDILRERTQEIYSSKKSTEEAIKRKKQERKGKDQERKQIYTEIARKKEQARTIKGEKKSAENELDAIQQQLEELEQKRMELMDLIFDLQHEQEEMEREKTSLEDGIKEDEEDWTCPVSVDTSNCGSGHLRCLFSFRKHSFILRRALVVQS